MAFGLTLTGFVPKSFAVIREEINADIRAFAGASIDLSDNSIEGQIVAIVSERYDELWQLAQAIYSADDPDAATGVALEDVCALTGTTREEATRSRVALTLVGDTATVIAVGSRVATASTDKEFETLSVATLATLTPWAATTAYVIGARRHNAGRSYVCTVAGTSAGAGGPITNGLAIVDGTVTWRYLGEGIAVADTNADALELGPVVAVSGDIRDIVTPVSGWRSVVNLLDATVGRALEADADLRVRREVELAEGGAATAEAIRNAILDLPGVTTCTVFFNDGDVTDPDGVPPHAVETLVQGGEDQDIYDELFFVVVAAGIATHGTQTGSVTDSQGTSHVVKFSRPIAVNIYVDVTAIVNPLVFPANGSDQIKQAVANLTLLGVGRDAVASRVAAAVFQVAGVLDVTDIDIGTAPAPTLGTTIVITSRQLASYDTSRVTTSLTNGTP